MPAPDLSAPTLTVDAWSDPVIDTLGYAPRSTYVERFWLSILGPSTTWLVRHIDTRLEADPDGFTLDLEATASALGLGTGRGRHSPLVRALHRCCQFGVARAGADHTLSVRRHLPPLTRHQIDRLPPGVRSEHGRWREVERDAATLDAQQRRARRVALALAELGEDVATTEQRLHRWKIHPVVARDAAVWAHRLLAARDPDVSFPPPEEVAATPDTRTPQPVGGPAPSQRAVPPPTAAGGRRVPPPPPRPTVEVDLGGDAA
ncbi:hypothetical protein [Iamia sp.]|uniref:hypothetical protein n=1 Tax=Iamia sp. TaxID=2722710 RepID=UPI002C62A0BF|nr:hypothetical protein [Iamia sp.]HXH58050.1 hypothetical protein [Iamia sp.]